jgi:tetratricopeptide (TPR) repeat protein
VKRSPKVLRRRYKYDAALSFAGEDRTLAAALSRHLKRLGLSVFYDFDHQAELWGKTPEVFAQIYGPQSRYVIPLVSEHYAQKDWTQFEFDSARREQRKRGREFILPVRLDDTQLFGLPDNKIRLDARQQGVAQIAKLFAEKCGVWARPGSRTSGTVYLRAVALLRPDARRALGLIATAALPLPRAYFEKLFPKYDWRRLAAEFRNAGLTEGARGFIALRHTASRALTSDRSGFKEFNQLWIDRLRPLKGHVDTAVFLTMHLMRVRQFEEAALVAATIGNGLEPGSWTGAYLRLLQALRHRRSFRALSRQTRLELLNSLGTTLSSAGEHSEALRVFADLRRLSRSYRSSWGLGQSLINAGVAAHKLGDTTVSVRMYERAASAGKRSNDHLLLGRALSNLAQSIQAQDLPRAERLLEESLRAKAQAHDSAGLAMALAVRAGFAVSKREFAAAAQLFKKASTAFLRLGMRHEYALSTYNEGRALQDSGNIRAAVRLFAKARAAAKDAGFLDVLRLSLNVLGASQFAQGQHARSRDCGIALLAAARRAHSEEDELGALHMIAVSHLALGDTRGAKLQFRQAIAKARRRHADEFLSRCLIDSTRPPIRRGVGSPDRKRLQRIAKRELARHSSVAAYIWRAVARVAAADGLDDASASNAYATAIHCLSSPSAARLKVGFIREHFAWAWQRRRYDEALRALEDLERGDSRVNPSDGTAARDQRGVCLQDLGRHTEAEPLHRSAAAQAHRAGDLEQEERSLNNLGESLRAQDRHREAIEAFRRSEAIAMKGRRHEGAISTAHNRALALEQQGHVRSAWLVLRRCRDEARRRHLWREHIRSLEGLARLAWLGGGRARALRLYERAMREAQNHGLGELQPRIALSIARGSLAVGRAKQGLAVLSRFQDSFPRFVDAHRYLGTLAELQNAVGQTSKAVESWRAAKRHAQALGDVEQVRYYERHEVLTEEAVQRGRRTEVSLRAALAVEQLPDQRAVLMIQLVELLLRRKKTASAQAAFADALRLFSESRLAARTCELYMVVAETTLWGSRAEQLNALKAYVMAMITTIESDPDSFASLAARIAFRIASPDSPVKGGRLRALIRDLKSVLAAEMPIAPADARRVLLWPFDFAVRLVRLRKQPELMEDAVRRLATVQSLSGYLSTGRVTA